jgi:Na+-translocating ferredoxin:NAD+ oxidoreductase subunit C
LKTFKMGGVHPPENKLSANSAIKVLPIPETVSIPISQHLGVPAKPVVSKGDFVKTGQLIAKGEAFISANVHASATGKVLNIGEIHDSSGYNRPAVVIQTQEDQWMDTIDLSPDMKRECNLGPEEIVAKILEMGIVGMGGAAFPSHVKLMIPRGKTVEYLIINGVECEPYLTADHRLMLEYPHEILVGITIQMKALQVSKAIIGVENNKPDVIDLLKDILPQYPGIEVEALKVKYPQGGEKQLIKALLRREVPSGKLPVDIGCVVHNVGTCFAAYQAVQKNKPLIERVVTVTGKSIKEPSNFMVRLGTAVSCLLDAAGGLPGDTGKVVNGGPMMGKTLSHLDTPITKGTSGILIIPETETNRKAVKNCIRCGRCASICPMGLEPYLLAVLSEKQKYDQCEKERIMDCMECGSCLYICPSGRPLLDHLRVGKSKVSKIIRARHN